MATARLGPDEGGGGELDLAHVPIDPQQARLQASQAQVHHHPLQAHRQANGFIENSIGAGILLGGKGQAHRHYSCACSHWLARHSGGRIESGVEEIAREEDCQGG